jgi:lysozyme family protein
VHDQAGWGPCVTDPEFERCLPFILKEEGGNDDDPQDHGGRTSRGITQREYTAWRNKKGLLSQDVWDATTQEVHDIYYTEYWLPKGPALHPGVALVYFNFAVNAGPGEAHKLLLRSIGGTDIETVNRFCNEGEAFYRALAQFSRYGKGWTARTERIRAAAAKMVLSPAPQPQKEIKPMTATPATDPVTGISFATIENDINIGLSVVSNVLPFLSLIPGFGPIAALLTTAVSAVRAVESSVNGGTSAAVAETMSHLTPGAPNSNALGPTVG